MMKFLEILHVILLQRDFILYILPFGLIKLRTFHLAHGLVSCNINAGVSFRDVKIKIPDRNWGQGIWVTSRTGIVDWDLSKSSELSSRLGRRRLISELGKARRICALRAPCVGWVESWRCKSSQHIMIVSPSLHVEKTFKLKKVNKSFGPEPIS